MNTTSATSAVPEPPPGWLTLVVDTGQGALIRHVPPASPLRDDIKQGTAAEEATHEAASMLGLPDFVYAAKIRQVGSGTRELGDGLIIIGDAGVALQVKSREAMSADTDKERRWISKVVNKGLSQAGGTIRQLKREPAALTNRRGRTLEIDGNDLDWLICLVIDHEDPPREVVPDITGTGYPTVVLLRRDWDFLFDHLKSMHAVVQYLQRVADESIELGTEPSRYYQYATADEAADPDPIDPALLAPDGRSASTPLLPLEPAGLADQPAHLMVRIIQEDIAESPLGTMAAEKDRLKILADIDLLPVALRADWGRVLLDELGTSGDVPEDETGWRFRRFNREVGPDRVLQLGLGVCSDSYGHTNDDYFGSWVLWRHYQVQQRLGPDRPLRTIGVLLTPRRDGLRPWDTTLKTLDGPLELTPEEVTVYREAWELHRVNG
jgi:hypothetical protein